MSWTSSDSKEAAARTAAFSLGYIRIIILIEFCLGIAASNIALAQPQINLSRLYDNGDEADFFYDVYYCNDGDFLLCGSSGLSTWAVRLDPEGNRIWDYFGARARLYSIIEADNGDAVATGGLIEGFGGLRLDAEGRVIWRRTHTTGAGSAIIELKEGDFVITGGELHDGFNEAIVSRINGDGEALWTRRFGDENRSQSFRSLREFDENIILAGAVWTDSTNSGWIQRMDLNGGVVWSRTFVYQGYLTDFRSIISLPRGGFAVGGSAGDPDSPKWVVYEIDADGEPFLIAEIEIPSHTHFFQCIDKLNDGGIVAVGTTSSVQRGNYPYVARLDLNGNVSWTTDLHDLVPGGEDGVMAKALLHSVICLPEDVIVAAGTNLNGRNWSRTDGWLVRFESDQLRPSIFYRRPEDSLQTILLGDSIRFIVKARDRMDREITYRWRVDDRDLDRGGVSPVYDTTVTIRFEDFGRIPVTCTVANVDWQVLTGWLVHVRSLFIFSHSPDTLNLALRRGTSLDFSLDSVAAIAPQEEIGYQWTLTDLDNFGRWDAGAEAGATIEFLRSGNFRLEGLAFAGEGDSLAQDNIIWTIQVRSAILDFLPHSLSLSVSRGATITFELIPFNPDSDSLRNQWLFDGEGWDVDSLAARVPFVQEGEHLVQGILMDGMDGDTIIWHITVLPPASSPNLQFSICNFQLLPPSPNPFNSSTTIRFSAGGSEVTELAVYDLSGRLIADLLTGGNAYPPQSKIQNHTSEVRSVVWNASSLPSGIYIIRLQSAGSVVTRKALLVR